MSESPALTLPVTPHPAEPIHDQHHARRWMILTAITLAQLIIALDSTIMNIALPSAQQALGFSTDNRQWIVTAYALAFGALLLPAGRLSDTVGRKAMFLTGLGGFAIASALGGAAQNFETLVVARALQGAFGAVLAPAALSLLTVIFSNDRERARALAISGTVTASGGAIGLVLGGALTEYVSWRWSLYINLPLAALAGAGGALLLKRQHTPAHARQVDLPGTLLIVAALSSLVYGLANAESNGWSSMTTLLCVGLGVTLIAFFGIVEGRVAHPLLPLEIVRDRTRGGSFLAIGISGVGLFVTFLFLTYYMSQTLGYAALKTGLAFLPMIGGLMTAATASTALITRVGPRIPVASGMLVAAVGAALLTRLELDSSYLTGILPALIISGVGIGLFFAPAISAATSGVDTADAGAASAMVNTVQQVGGSIGIAVMSAFAATAASNYLAGKVPTPHNHALAVLASYSTVFWWIAGIYAAGAVISALLIRGRSRAVDAGGPTPALGHRGSWGT